MKTRARPGDGAAPLKPRERCNPGTSPLVNHPQSNRGRNRRLWEAARQHLQHAKPSNLRSGFFMVAVKPSSVSAGGFLVVSGARNGEEVTCSEPGDTGSMQGDGGEPAANEAASGAPLSGVIRSANSSRRLKSHRTELGQLPRQLLPPTASQQTHSLCRGTVSPAWPPGPDPDLQSVRTD